MLKATRSTSRRRLQEDVLLLTSFWIITIIPTASYSPVSSHPLRLQPLSRRSARQNLPTLLSSSSSDSPSPWNEDPLEWKPHNVYRDLDRLEQAINFQNREVNLILHQRREVLQFLPQCRKSIRSVFVNYFWKPLAGASLLFCFMQKYAVVHTIVSVLDFVHLLGGVLFLPFLILLRSHKEKVKCNDVPDEKTYERIKDSEYSRFVTQFPTDDDPCANFTRSITEQWCSVVLGSILLLPTLLRLQAPFLRLAVAASIRQHPKLLYELRHRPSSPRPFHGSTWALRHAVSLLYTRWFVALEIMQSLRIFSRVPKGPVILAALFVTMGMITLVSETIPKEITFKPILRKRYALITTIALILFYQPNYNLRLGTVTSFVESAMSYIFSNKMTFLLSFLSTIGPSLHIIAFSRLLRFSYIHDLPLTLDHQSFDEAARRRRMWRCRLEWREPQPLRAIIKNYWGRFWYWLFLSGSVEDQLRKDRRNDGYTEVKRRGLTVLQQIEKEAKGNDEDLIPRDQWKQVAMERIARDHQRDYDKGTYEDPLGVAVQQTLGIGLGFNFDHMSKLRHPSQLSTRRLQARAAKSAIKHVQDIMNVQQAREILEEIDDPDTRKNAAKSLRDTAEKEIDFLKGRLSDLVPTNSCPELDQDLSVYQMSQPDRSQNPMKTTWKNESETDFPLDIKEFEAVEDNEG